MKYINSLALSMLVLLSITPYAYAQNVSPHENWVVDVTHSQVSFVTIKKGNIAESHIFNDVSGHIRAGKASITIKPDSVDSRVPIRNERMREFLFETSLFPSIKINADVNHTIAELLIGQSSLTTVPATLSLHGVRKDLRLEVRISKLNANTLIVASTLPILIRSADYNMREGIATLSSLVNNLPIAETVPVNFTLQFQTS